MGDKSIPPSSMNPPVDTSEWPLLLKNFSDLVVRTGHFTPLPFGCSPLARKLKDHLLYGIINLDKPVNPSSHEVVSWIKRILKREKTGHSGTLDPKVSGCLLVCLDRATRLVKAQQSAGKQYVCVAKFHADPGGKEAVIAALNKLQGAIFQRPPVTSNVKRSLRLRSVYHTDVCDYDKKNWLFVFKVDCEAGFYVRTLCIHLGLLLGVGAHMADLRRVRSGILTEADDMVSMHDVLDAQTEYEASGQKSEAMLRRVVLPLERILMKYPRIVVKDSCVNAICYGAKLMIPGVLRFEKNIEVGDEIVMMTCKGEGIAIGVAQLSSAVMAQVDHGVAAVIKRCIMDRDTYSGKIWGLGEYAMMKKELIAAGQLNEKGRAHRETTAATLQSLRKTGYLPRLCGTQPEEADEADEVEESPKKRKHKSEKSEKSEKKRRSSE